MIKCNKCNGLSPSDAQFCIECGKHLEYTGETKILSTNSIEVRIENYAIPTGAPYPFVDMSDNNESPFTAGGNGDCYFMYKKDLLSLLRHESTYVRKTNYGYSIYYKGRKVIFID